jgi:hypothetical protein
MNLMGALATSWDFGGNSTMKAFWTGWKPRAAQPLELERHLRTCQGPAFSSRVHARRPGDGDPRRARAWCFYFESNGSPPKPWFWS